MFAKLLKHEWKANAPLLSVLSIAAVCVGLLGGVTMRLTASSPADGELRQALMESLDVMSHSFVMLALFLYAAAVCVVLIYRFYKNKFSEQGYLTFTLPVTGHQILLSSLVSMFLWQLIAGLTVLVSVALMNLISSIGQEAAEVTVDIKEVFDDIFRYADDEEIAQIKKTVVLALLRVPVAWLYGNVVAMASITLGAAWAKKHKLLTAFAISFGASYLLSFVSGIVSVFAAVSTSVQENPFLAIDVNMITNLIAQVLLAVGGYFLSHYMITRKLNLK